MDRAKLEAGTPQLQLDKLRAFHDNPEFIACLSERVSDALNQIPEERRASAGLIFTAHSIPMVMANSSPYVAQLTKACEAVAGSLGRSDWRLVYQSRSGPPSQPWLEPDIGDALREFAAARGKGAAVVVSPVGFVSDHMEVLYDLDTEASQLCLELGIHMVRALTPGVHPRFVSMIRGLIAEAVAGSEAVMADCAVDCCPPPPRRPAGPPAGSRPE
jgi:ferrochelatase